MDFFRNLFGFHDHQPNDSQRFFGFHEEDNSNEPNERRTFDVFTDPLEMHRYFEQQMEQIFRTFSFPNFGHFFNEVPAIEGRLHEDNLEGEPKSLREKYLKKEYVKPHYQNSGEKMDKDLDGVLNLGDFDSADPSNKSRLDTYRERKPFQGTFFNQSVQVKTIRKSDGSLETQRTVRDSQGNEETTITQKLGDKEYTVIKKLDKDGKEETQEIMVNMNENDKGIFQETEGHEPIRPLGEMFDSSLFNRFFK